MARVLEIEYRGQQDKEEIDELRAALRESEKEAGELGRKLASQQSQEVVNELKRRLSEMEESYEEQQ